MRRARHKKTKLDAIKMLVLDVDGVLTDGTIVVDARGQGEQIFQCSGRARDKDVEAGGAAGGVFERADIGADEAAGRRACG